MTTNEVMSGLGQLPSGVSGLSQAIANARLTRDGPNQIVPESGKNRLARWMGPLKDPMVALLLIAAPTYMFIGDTTDAIITLVALVPVVAIGWLLEGRAERALRQLRVLTAPTAIVLRDGQTRVVPAGQLVVGDICWLREGDVIPADAQIVVSTQLSVDESALTGESMPVAKNHVRRGWKSLGRNHSRGGSRHSRVNYHWNSDAVWPNRNVAGRVDFPENTTTTRNEPFGRGSACRGEHLLHCSNDNAPASRT